VQFRWAGKTYRVPIMISHAVLSQSIHSPPGRPRAGRRSTRRHRCAPTYHGAPPWVGSAAGNRHGPTPSHCPCPRARVPRPAPAAEPSRETALEKRLSRNGSQEIESAALTHQSLQLRAARGPEGAMQADHHICEQPAPALAGLPPSPEACAATLRVSVELTSEPRLARACAVSE
jgi:hypothetical protein